MGSIDKEAIRAVIHTNRGEIRDCYEKRIEAVPKLAGKVAVKFVIGADGRVMKSALAESTTGDPELENCVVTRVGTWTFPPPRGGGIVVVTYPFLFKQVPVKGTVKLAEGNPPKGGLTRKALSDVFETNRGELVGCYDKSLQTAPKLEGSMSLELVIGADGRVTKANVAESTTRDRELEGCVVARVGTWTFPPPTEGGTVSIVYPLIFLQAPANSSKAAPAPKQ